MKGNAVQRVAILGCGYVGTALGRELRRAGREVTATTTSPARLDELRDCGWHAVTWRSGDIGGLRDILGAQDAAVLCVAPAERGADYRGVYLAAVTDLVAALPHSAVSRVIYTSSTRVYGQENGEWVDESSPARPRDEAGRILLEAEHVLLNGVAKQYSSSRRDGSATVLRLSGIYGPGRDPGRRVRALSGSVRDDGDEWVNLIHVEDIVAAMARLLDVPHHGVLNVSDDAPTTRRAYYDRLLARAGLPPIRWTTPSEQSPRGKRIRNDRIKELLGLTLRHPGH